MLYSRGKAKNSVAQRGVGAEDAEEEMSLIKERKYVSSQITSCNQKAVSRKAVAYWM